MNKGDSSKCFFKEHRLLPPEFRNLEKFTNEKVSRSRENFDKQKRSQDNMCSSNFQSMEKENEEYKKTICSTQNSSANQQSDGIKKSSSNQTENLYERLKKEYTKVMVELQQAQLAFENQQSEIKMTTKELCEESRKVANLQQDVISLANELQFLESKNEVLLNHINELNSINKQLTYKEEQHTRVDTGDTVSDSTYIITSLKEENEQMKKLLTQAKREKSELEKQVQNLKNSLKQMELEQSSQKIEECLNKKSYSMLQRNYEEMQEIYSTLQQNYDDLQNQNGNLLMNYQQIMKDYNFLTTQNQQQDNYHATEAFKQNEEFSNLIQNLENQMQNQDISFKNALEQQQIKFQQQLKQELLNKDTELQQKSEDFQKRIKQNCKEKLHEKEGYLKEMKRLTHKMKELEILLDIATTEKEDLLKQNMELKRARESIEQEHQKTHKNYIKNEEHNLGTQEIDQQNRQKSRNNRSSSSGTCEYPPSLNSKVKQLEDIILDLQDKLNHSTSQKQPERCHTLNISKNTSLNRSRQQTDLDRINNSFSTAPHYRTNSCDGSIQGNSFNTSFGPYKNINDVSIDNLLKKYELIKNRSLQHPI